MVKFIVRLSLVLLPSLLVLGYLEFRLSRIDTHYYSKRESLESQLDSLEVLVLGSSNAYYNIDPAHFSRLGYNLAFNAQSMYYDDQLLSKYIDRMPKLKVVVLPAIFFTIGTDLPKNSQNWRMYFYRQYFGIPLESGVDEGLSLTAMIEPKNYSKIALYGNNTYDYMKKRFKVHVDYVPEKSGWYDSSTVAVARMDDNNGKIAADAHNATVDAALFAKNLSYWQHTVSLLKEKNINAVIVRMPALHTYYENLDRDKFAQFDSALRAFASRNGLGYFDYSWDKRFSVEDYTVMIDHMNPHGAAKFSTIIDDEVLKPLCSSTN